MNRGRVRVMVAAGGSVVNVTRVVGEHVVSVIWQRPSSLSEAPFTHVFEAPVPEPRDQAEKFVLVSAASIQPLEVARNPAPPAPFAVPRSALGTVVKGELSPPAFLKNERFRCKRRHEPPMAVSLLKERREALAFSRAVAAARLSATPLPARRLGIWSLVSNRR